MTESEWWDSDDHREMLYVLRDKASTRKLRMYACGCCRQVPYYDPHVIGLVEGYADGLVKRKEAQAAVKVARFSGGISVHCLDLFWANKCHHGAELTGAFTVATDDGLEDADAARLLRCIFGNPFRPVTINPIWLTPTVTNLSQAAYEERILPSGELDPARLAVLSDALEEAGCDNADILGHLRSPGPHVRGCWAVDLLTGRS